MSRIKLFLIALFVASAFFAGSQALAQGGTGISPVTSFLKRAGNVVTFLNSSWQLGDASNRIAAVYTTVLDASSVAIGGVVTGDQTITGNQTVYGSGGVTALKFHATSTDEGLLVDGRSQLTGNVTTTGGIRPATHGGADIGSAAYPYSGIYATGTVQLGGALTVSNVNGGDSVQIGWEQSPAKAASASNQSFAPLNIYASSTGFQDTFTITAGGNGTDGACFAAKNLGATLGRHCQTSSPLGYWIMGTAIAFNSGNTTPYGTANVDLQIRNNNVGVGLPSGTAPTEKLEVIGTASTTALIVSGGTVGTPGIRLNGDADTGIFSEGANIIGFGAGGTLGVSMSASDSAFRPITGGTVGLGTLTKPFSSAFFNNTVSSTSLIVSGVGTMRSAGLGSLATGMAGYLDIHHDPSLSEANSPFINLQNASTTLRTQIQFTNAAGDGAIGTITAFGENSPVGDFGFSAANMIFLESTSGTVITAGDGATIFSSSGALRPITGLGFGNNDNIDPYNATASTTISNGNMSTVALDFPNSAAAGTQDLTVTVAGASAGDECQLAGADFAASLFSRASESYTCVGTAANTMTVRRTCVAGAGCGDPASVNANVGFFARQ